MPVGTTAGHRTCTSTRAASCTDQLSVTELPGAPALLFKTGVTLLSALAGFENVLPVQSGRSEDKNKV